MTHFRDRALFRRQMFRQTIDVHGEEPHAHLARLTVGIVGVGSVGSFVAELLVRMRYRRLVLIGFDFVLPHNLDRTVLSHGSRPRSSEG